MQTEKPKPKCNYSSLQTGWNIGGMGVNRMALMLQPQHATPLSLSPFTHIPLPPPEPEYLE